MKILDYLGKLWNSSTVGKGNVQTGDSFGTKWLQWQYQKHPASGLTPEHLRAIFERAERGELFEQSELFMDMEERDTHLFAEMSKRKRTVIGLPRSVTPPPDPTPKELDTADRMNDLLSRLHGFDTMLFDLLDAIGHGFSAIEIEWTYTDKIWQPLKFTQRPQSWFQLDIETRTILRLRNMTWNGEDLWPFGWIIHKHGAKSGYMARSGLYRVLAWPWLMKQYSLRDLAEYLEIYGIPPKIGKYPRGAPQEDRDGLYRALQQLGRNAAGVMPDDMSLDFINPRLGSSDPFMGMVEYCDAVISLAIVGQTLSGKASNTGLGSGVAGLQADVRKDLMEADALQLSNTVALQLVNPIIDLNGWGEGRPFGFTFDVSSPDDLTAFSTSIKTLAESGLKMPASWVRQKARIPDPSPEDEVIGGVVTPGTPQLSDPVDSSDVPAPLGITKSDGCPCMNDAGDQPEIAIAVADKPDAVDTQPAISTYVDSQVDRLVQDMNPMLEAILKRIRVMLDDSTSLTEFQDKLVKWFPETETLDLTKVLTTAFTAAELAGRYDAGVSE